MAIIFQAIETEALRARIRALEATIVELEATIAKLKPKKAKKAGKFDRAAYMREYMRARRARRRSTTDSGSASDNHSPSDPQSSSVQALPNPPQTS
jgi:multidrug resistance efflux pump